MVCGGLRWFAVVCGISTVRIMNRTLAKFASLVIRKTLPCDSYPLAPHFYLVKLGFTGVYIFLILL